MCFGRDRGSALTVPAVRQAFACQRQGARSSRSRIDAGRGTSRRRFAYLNGHGVVLPPEPRDLQGRLTRRPARPAQPACAGEPPGPPSRPVSEPQSDHRRTAGATNKTHSQRGGCCHVYDVGL